MSSKLSQSEESKDVSDSDDDDEEPDFDPKSLVFQSKSVERQWLRNHGKQKYIDFEDE